MSSTPGGTARDLVDRALESPREVLDSALVLLRAGPGGLAPHEMATLHLAAAIAGIEVHDIDLAEEHARTGVACAEEVGDVGLLARCRSVHGWVCLLRGEVAAGLALIRQALPDLTGGDRARTLLRAGLAEQRLGRHDEALESYAAAEAALHALGDRTARARLLLNRGALHAYLGRTADAVADLEVGRAEAAAVGQRLAATLCAQNLGFALGRAGDVVAALEWLRTAREELVGLPDVDSRVADLDLDTASVLAAAGLFAEARARAADAADALAALGQRTDHAEAVLVQARLAFAAGAHADALALARTAEALLAEQGRPGWALQAGTVALLAEASTAREGAEVDLDAAMARCADLAAQGWLQEADQASVELAMVAIDRGRLQTARALAAARSTATSAAAGGAGGGAAPPPATAARWHHVAARLALASSAPEEARGHLRAGLATLEQTRLTLGSTELQARWAVHAQALAREATALALREDDPWAALDAVDTWRSRSMTAPAVRPPPDPELTALLTRLRGAEAAVVAARAAGEDPTGAIVERDHLEAAVLRRTRARTSGPPRGHGSPAVHGGDDGQREWGGDLRDLADALASAPLPPVVLSLFTLDGVVHAVRIWAGRATLHLGLADTAAVLPLVGGIGLALRRLALPGASAAGARTAVDGLAERGRRLDAALLAPLLAGVDPDAPLLVVPADPLHNLAWGALPSAARGLSVLPAVVAARPDPLVVDPDGVAVFVAGPGLPGADAEVRRLVADRPPDGTRCLVGDGATAAATLAALEGAEVGHIAAHGTFRTDNALFSCLHMADGPLTVHELESLRRPPRAVVLPACDTGRSEVTGGGELLGVAAALLRGGVRSLLAPVVAVPDTATVALMLAVHDGLRAGLHPPQALRRAVASLGPPDGLAPPEVLASAAFVCLGS